MRHPNQNGGFIMFHVADAKKQRAEKKLEMVKLMASAGMKTVDPTTEEGKKNDKLMVEIAEIDAAIARHEAGASLAAPGTRVPGTPVINTERGITPDGFSVPIFAKGQSVADHLKKTGAASDLNFGEMIRAMVLGGGRAEVRNSLSEGTDSAGGYTVPSILSGQLIDKLRAKSVMFQAGARTVLLETGKPTTIAAITGDATATWRAENDAVATSDMTFAPVSFTPKSLSVIVIASQELVEDSTNLGEAITLSLTNAFASELDRVALIGSGSSNQPLGVSKTSGVGSYSMGTNGAAPTSYQAFIEALGILQGANANDPTAAILNPHVNKELNSLVDTLGQPMRKPDAIQNLPFLVTSKLPQTETQGSSNVASRGVVGYFPDVLIGVRTFFRIQVLREAYAGNGQIGFKADLRADVAVAHAANFCNIVGLL
jgi:HK97 family phage major capsid protein